MIITEPTRPSLEQLQGYERGVYPFLCWRSIAGGTVAAIGVHILLAALGIGVGLASFKPSIDSDPAATFNVGAAIVWTICALIALSFGGFVAGRFSRSLHSGFVHGVLVWSLTLIVTVLLLSMGTGMVLGGALKVLGEGLGIGAKAAAAPLAEAISPSAKRVEDQLSSFVNEAVQSESTNAAPQGAIRAQREIGFALNRLFNRDNASNLSENRNLAVKALKDFRGMSDVDATRTIEEWTASSNALQEELAREKGRLEQRAREVAEQASKNVSKAGLWSFFALLIGLLVTALSGQCGAHGALRTLNPKASPGTSHGTEAAGANRAP